MAVTLAQGQLQDALVQAAQAALPAIRFLMGRSNNGFFFFSPRKRAGGHPYSHHVPTWCLLGLVGTPQTSSVGRRSFSVAKRNQTCLPGPVREQGVPGCPQQGTADLWGPSDPCRDALGGNGGHVSRRGSGAAGLSAPSAGSWIRPQGKQEPHVLPAPSPQGQTAARRGNE